MTRTEKFQELVQLKADAMRLVDTLSMGLADGSSVALSLARSGITMESLISGGAICV